MTLSEEPVFSLLTTSKISVWLKTLAVVICAWAFSVANAETQIAMLGTGTPVHDPERSGPSVAIVVDGRSYVFDFGPGLVRRAAALSPRFGGDIQALKASSLNVAFLTHLHSDHTAGFADLLLTGWSSGNRDVRMKVFGPDGTQQLVAGIHDAYEDDIKYRLYHRGKSTDQGWRVDVGIVEEGLVYADDSIRVIAFPVKHGSWPNAFGYRAETNDKTVVISGDLRPNDKIREYSENADYLIHEVFCEAGFKKRSEEDQKYHANNHTSTRELAELANQVKPGVLVLTHVLFFGCTADEILAEVQEDYEGKVIFSEDLDVYK
jgi:ribonuclease Z